MRLDIEEIKSKNFPRNNYMLLMGDYGEEFPFGVRIVYFGYVDKNGFFYYGTLRLMSKASLIKFSYINEEYVLNMFYSDNHGYEGNGCFDQGLLERNNSKDYLIYKTTKSTVDMFNKVKCVSDVIRLFSLMGEITGKKMLPK